MCSHCHLVLFFLPFCDNNSGFIDLGAGLAVGISGLAAGFAIGIVGDSGVRGTAQQPRVSVVLNLVDKEREEVFLSHISEFGSLNATSLTRAFFCFHYLSPPPPNYTVVCWYDPDSYLR